MRILIISYHFWPENNVRSNRWTAIINNWAEKNIMVDVICSQKVSYEDRNLYNFNIFSVIDPINKFYVKKKTTKSTLSIKKNTIKNLLFRISKRLFSIIRWPDFACFWIPKVYVKAKELLRKNHYDGIITVSMPFSSHIPMLLLKPYRKDIPWICDYGDPFSFSEDNLANNIRLYNKFNKFIEKKVLYDSKRISLTTEETVAKYEDIFALNKKFFKVIPPLVQKVKINLKSRTNNQINLVFAGHLYLDIRNPAFLLKLMRAVKKKLKPINLKLHFYGNILQCQSEFSPYKDEIGDWLFIHDRVDKKSLFKVYENANVLVNIGNKSSYQLPSKVIEYMSTGLPILNIHSIKKDLSLKVLIKYSNSISIIESDIIFEKTIDELCKFILNPKLVSDKSLENLLEIYGIESISNKYLEMFKE